jgi:hypothetical protein
VRIKSSYLIVLSTLLLAGAWSGTRAQSIYLDPEITYVTAGVGTEFDVEVRVSDGLPSLKSFIYHIDFNPTKLDTVSVTQGPLFPSSGAGTAFGAYIVQDTILQVEDLILGAGIDVSGPGLVATIRFRVLDAGTVVLAVTNHRLRDVAGTLLETDAYGGVVYINVPPQEFNLLSPIGGASVSGLPGDLINLSWEEAESVYPGENTIYTLEYTTSPAFGPAETSTVPDLTTNSYGLDVGELECGYEGTYYWRVTAAGDLYGLERTCTPESETFDFGYTPVAPNPFALLAPTDGATISGVSQVLFDWDDATSLVPCDEIDYVLFVALHPSVQADILIEQPVMASEYLLSIGGLPRNTLLYWRVGAYNKYSVTFSTSIRSVIFPGCCVGRVGDANNSGEDEPTISDISTLIDAKFITGTCDGKIECLQEADINQSGGLEPTCDDVTISDISILIDYLFITGPTLGLADCL